MDESLVPANPQEVIDLLQEWVAFHGCHDPGCDHYLCVQSMALIKQLEDTIAASKAIVALIRSRRRDA